jgi:hypothetical protein
VKSASPAEAELDSKAKRATELSAALKIMVAVFRKKIKKKSKKMVSTKKPLELSAEIIII